MNGWNFTGHTERCTRVRWWYLRGLSVLSFLAFLSFLQQYRGLVGSTGISPVSQYLQRAGEVLGKMAYLRFPTLAWGASTDTALMVYGMVGMIFSVILLFNYLPRIMLAGIWILYLSVTVAGQKFMSYQWNQLLLEMVFASIWIAPLGGRLGRVTIPSWFGIWYLRFLLFKLYILSGLAKWSGGPDSTWKNLTAMDHHYETQPLPNPLSWFFHHLPDWIHRIETAAALIIEIILPFFVFLPRRNRIPAAYGMASI